MPVQQSVTLINKPFLEGYGIGSNEVIAQNAGRSTTLAQFTVMTKTAATQKWVPFTTVSATDGTSHIFGILLSDSIPAASIVAGDVSARILVGGSPCFIDQNQIVFENSMALNSVIGASSVNACTCQDKLGHSGIYLQNQQIINA
jgi:hypothetical protein